MLAFLIKFVCVCILYFHYRIEFRIFPYTHSDVEKLFPVVFYIFTKFSPPSKCWVFFSCQHQQQMRVRQWMMICGIVIFTTKVFRLFFGSWGWRVVLRGAVEWICFSIYKAEKKTAADSISGRCDKASFRC